jgi:transcriptional regulator with AAA-type ATPase domain
LDLWKNTQKSVVCGFVHGAMMLGMDDQETVTKTVDRALSIGPKAKIPGLLVAYASEGVCTADRYRINPPTITVGRRVDNDFVLRDDIVSGTHFRIFECSNRFVIEDVGSKNGTFVNGARISEPTRLSSGTLIRAGGNLLVFEDDASAMFDSPPSCRYDMAGPFYVASIVDELDDSVRDGRHILIVGETGVGKELAARAIADMVGENGASASILVHNCAHFGSEDEANASLLGVGARVFSEVDSRAGLVEQARGGLLFLDEANCLPPRVQKSLLRLIEDHLFKRIGESTERKNSARIIFASNDVVDSNAGLIHDLYPRLRVVKISSLKERVADIPTIFQTLLRQSLKKHSIDEDYYTDHMNGEHFEMICLARGAVLRDNVRGLNDMAKRLAVKAVKGKAPAQAINDVLGRLFSFNIDNTNPRPSESDEKGASQYQRHKSTIIETYFDREQRVTPTVRVLKSMGISVTRQHLSRYLKKWGVKGLER